MKKFLYYMSLLFLVVVPISIFYFQYDAFAIVAAEHLKTELTIFLDNYRYGIEVEGINWFAAIKYLFWIVLVTKIVDTKFIGNRITGLGLLQRRGDWVLSIWFIAKINVIWYGVYLMTNYLGINTDSMLESVNWVFYSIILGTIIKVISTYRYSVDGIK